MNAELEQIASSTDPFPVDFDRAWQWIGYARKDVAKDALLRQFANPVDFTSSPVETGNGGRPAEAIRLTVDCFKAFCMMAGTEQGRKVRAYFIECERRLKNPQIDVTSLSGIKTILQGALGRIEYLEAQNQELSITASAHEALTASAGCCSVADVAKVLSFGEHKFFEQLRKDKILQSTFQHKNVPYQTYIDQGFFIVRDRTFQVGSESRIAKTTFVTPKGEGWLAKRYGRQFILINGGTA